MKIRLKKSLLFWIAVVVVLTGALARYFFWQPKFVPEVFIEARQRSFDVAQSIVRFSNDSLIDLQSIAQADRTGDAKKALDLVKKALQNNQLARVEAIKLSATLEVMSKNVPNISPSQARDLATEGLGYEVTLINHLITYNDFLNELFKVLQAKFDGMPLSNSDALTRDWINRINEEGEAISTLNKKFNDTMLRFDRLTAA